MSNQRKKCQGCGKPKRGPYPNARGWQRVEFKFKDEATKHAALMRHAWYRKQIAAETIV